jgi:hypothetical protein
MKRTINFLDADRNKVVFNCEITNRNGYPEFTASGEYCGGLGQVFDEVKPATDKQTELIEAWRKYRLNGIKPGLPEDFENYINALLDDIEGEEEDRKGEPITINNETPEEVFKLIEDITGYTGRDAELCAAFIQMFDLCENDLQDIEIDGTRCTVQGIDYLAGTDEEMGEEWDGYLERYIDECLEIPEHIERYFDREAWKEDARYDGRGHSLNSYDGGEECAEINGVYYYAYRQ